MTVGGIVLAVVGVNAFGGSTSADANPLQVEGLAFADPAQIDAVTFPTSDATNTTPLREDASPIDITLKNNSNEPIRITRIETKVLDAKTVTCSRQGGGVAVSAFYSVKIPYNPWMMTLTSDAVTSDVDFTVKPTSADRMVITVGPETTGNGKAVVVAVSLKLIPESGDPIVLEPLALSQPSAVDGELRGMSMFTASEPGCAQEQVNVLDNIIKATDVQSPDVTRLRDGFRAAT
ncbi:hypothetical protein [Gordonia phosphorivorans]|uniref:Uncharacterized protein n=1 Tax=Gordonia phosphorivorans TaxID=1056982 RepID=A0ABV6H8V0_9ACTN